MKREGKKYCEDGPARLIDCSNYVDGFIKLIINNRIKTAESIGTDYRVAWPPFNL